VENEQGDVRRFRIVGPDEIYGRNDYVSIDAPMARALLKKTTDDEVLVKTPAGEQLWWINQISYTTALC
jgi:transcription elongation factor GreB